MFATMMFYIFCLFAAATAEVGTPLEQLDVEGTQILLREWDLHEAFGAEFRKLKYDGRFLSLLDMSDYHQNQFPNSHQAHWKVLLREINLKQSGHFLGRRLAATDTKAFTGIRIKKDSSLISFGKGEDVKLVRTGPKQLSVMAQNVNVNQLSAKSIAVDGVDLKKLMGGAGGGGCSAGSTGGGGGGGSTSTPKKKTEWVYFATDLGGICEEEDTIIESAKECAAAFAMARKAWKPTVTAATKMGKTELDMHKSDKGWDAYPAGCIYHNTKGGGLHVSTASKTNARKSDTYSICRRDKSRYKYYVTKLGGVCPESDLIESSVLCAGAYQSVRKAWKPTVTTKTKKGASYLDMHKSEAGWSAYPAGCMYHNTPGGGLHVSTASKTNVPKADTYAICQRDLSKPAPIVSYYATTLGKTCPSTGLIATAEECAEAYAAARKTWTPTVLNGKQGGKALDMHKSVKGWDAYPAGCMYHNTKGGGLHVSTASKTNKPKGDTYAICKFVVVPSLSLDSMTDYYATKLGGVCPSHGLINTVSECLKAYQTARRTWQPTNPNGRQGAHSLDLHKGDKGWDAYPAGCMYHNTNGGGLHVSTNSKTNKAKSDTYAICKRQIPGWGQIKSLAAYVKTLEKRLDEMEQKQQMLAKKAACGKTDVTKPGIPYADLPVMYLDHAEFKQRSAFCTKDGSSDETGKSYSKVSLPYKKGQKSQTAVYRTPKRCTGARFQVTLGSDGNCVHTSKDGKYWEHYVQNKKNVPFIIGAPYFSVSGNTGSGGTKIELVKPCSGYSGVTIKATAKMYFEAASRKQRSSFCTTDGKEDDRGLAYKPQSLPFTKGHAGETAVYRTPGGCTGAVFRITLGSNGNCVHTSKDGVNWKHHIQNKGGVPFTLKGVWFSVSGGTKGTKIEVVKECDVYSL